MKFMVPYSIKNSNVFIIHWRSFRQLRRLQWKLVSNKTLKAAPTTEKNIRNYKDI